MRHGKYFAFGLALCVLPAAVVQAAAAPQDIPRPKKDVPKQAAPKRAVAKPAVPRPAGSRQTPAKKNSVPEPLAFDPASKTTFITYDIGTLRLVGKSPTDATHAIGTLRMTGRAGAVTYAIGTLSMSGKRGP